nr:DNA repair protein RadA [Angustibacter aerolatus]
MPASTARKPAPRPAYRCAECGWVTSKWVGRCGECQAWGSVEEAGGAPVGRATTAGPVAPRRCPSRTSTRRPRTPGRRVSARLDRVLGGGLVPGAVVLVAGEPGIGKSTLLLDVCGRAAREGRRVLYLTGEESAAQVRLRADRIGALAADLWLAAETDLGAVLGHVDQVRPDLVVVDSVQTVGSAQVDGAPGGVSQVREVAAALIGVAKARGIATLLVGHVTKDGSIAGPRVLEHLVDVVVQFEGDRHSRLRLVRASKNRYGPTDEVGCFDLSDAGIVGLADPSGLFLSTGRGEPVPGTCVTVTLEGRRPLVTEVQSLVAPSALPTPRRATSGLDSSRVAMVTAVMDRRAGIKVGQADVYVSTVGGVKVAEPAADLAVALAIAGATTDRPLVPRTVAFGEVGLAGEIRPVGGVPRRLSEAARLGFTTAIVPVGALESGRAPSGLRVLEVADLAAAARVATLRAV